MTTPEIAETSLESLPPEQVYPIALRLPYRHLLQFCRTATRYRDICADPVFWAEKANFIYGLPISHFFRPTSQVPNPRDTPQRRYLQILTQHRDCERGSEQFTDVNDALRCAIRHKDFPLADYFKSKGANDATYALLGAIDSGDLNLVKHYDQGLYNTFRVLYEAGLEGPRDILDYLLYPPNRPPRTTYPYIRNALQGAAQGNHPDLIAYLISLGGTPTDVMYGAAVGNHLNLIRTYFQQVDPDDREYFIDDILKHSIPNHRDDIVNYVLNLPNLPLTSLNFALQFAAEAKNQPLIHRLRDLGANDMNEGLIGASRAQNQTLINYFISQGANDWQKALEALLRATPKDAVPNWDLINVFLQKINNAWPRLLSAAIVSENPELIAFFLDKPIQNYYLPIISSIWRRNLPLLQNLLGRAQLTLTRPQLVHAMETAIQRNNRAAFDRITQRLAQISFPDEPDFYLNQALITAIRSYRTDWIPHLIELGADNLEHARDDALLLGYTELANIIAEYLPEPPVNP
jgi:hypothetical protein